MQSLQVASRVGIRRESKRFLGQLHRQKITRHDDRDFTRMILEGLVSIHGHGYVNCDLKSDNLFVFPCGDSYELKISDFGNSLEVGDIPDYWDKGSPFVGTPSYMSPEFVEDGVAKKTLDLWSLGCLVLEMYTGERPWEGVDIDMIEALLFHGNAPWIPESVPCDAREFMETCFASNPEERGSVCELLLHRFLRGEEEKIVAVADTEERKNSLLLKIRGVWNKSTDIAHKPPKVKKFPLKPPQFEKILNNLVRSKIMPLMKHSDSNLLSVQ